MFFEYFSKIEFQTLLMQHFVDAKCDTIIGNLKFFIKKIKIIVFRKKVKNKKI